MHTHQRRFRKSASTIALWVGMGVTTVVLGHSLQSQTIETYIVGAAQPVGYAEITRWIQPGDAVQLVRDAAMPEGFERVYVEYRGERVGFLPESATRQGVRIALRDGIPVRGAVTAVDGQDPARGVTVLVTLGA